MSFIFHSVPAQTSATLRGTRLRGLKNKWHLIQKISKSIPPNPYAKKGIAANLQQSLSLMKMPNVFCEVIDSFPTCRWFYTRYV